MVFVGGNAGRASMRAHALQQLKRIGAGRKISFWYGGRNQREIFYVDEYCQLSAENEACEWHITVSDQNLEDCEFYVYRLPMMNFAVIGILEGLAL